MSGIIIRITWWLSHDGRPPDHSWVALPPVSLDVLSTACRQRHRPCGTRRVSTSTAYPAFECILAVVPHPLVSISETAGGHEGRWECQPLPTMPNKTQPSMGGICYLGNFLGDCHVRRVPRLRGLSRRESGGTTRVRWRGASYLGPSLKYLRYGPTQSNS